jgi:hypothetical protein
MQWRNQRKLFEYLRLSDVAGMNDSFTALQRRECFVAELAMGIGDHANFHARLQVSLKDTLPCSGDCVFRDQVLDSLRRTRALTASGFIGDLYFH